MTAALLETRGLTKRFSGTLAVDDLDIAIHQGELLGIVGPNGSGKTTLFNLVSGFTSPTLGEVFFDGQNVSGFEPHRLSKLGLCRTFQQAMSFPKRTVRENIAIAAEVAAGKSTGKSTDMAAVLDDVLETCGLTDDADNVAMKLPHGKQRTLGIAVALASGPRLMLLDEPSAGLGDDATRDLTRLISRIRERGVTVAIIDHDMPFLLPIADRVIVLETGRKLVEGLPSEIVADPRVIEVYLGAKID